MTKHMRPGNVVHGRFRATRSRSTGSRGHRRQPATARRSPALVSMVLVAAALGGLAVGFSLRRGPAVLSATDMPTAGIPFFGYCLNGGGANCVVDGDTFYYGRDKVRIANIDAPETHPPRCAQEAQLGQAATHRLRDLLNSGRINLASIDRDEDVYGRKLRIVAVGGTDVGATLVGEGLARRYGSGRRSWCESS